MIQAVPALAMGSGIFAWVASGATAIADGENTKPVSSFTLSLVMTSVATVLALAPEGGPSSRLINSILLFPRSFACSFTYRSNALSIWLPKSELGPE